MGARGFWCPVGYHPWSNIIRIIHFDIADCVSSNIELYADDTKIYRDLRNLTSAIQMLRSYLYSLGHWANR